MYVCFCCVKQKTAYEMRISDWSSDVCSSDLVDGVVEISVVEGRLGQVTVQVDPKAPIDEARVRAMLAPLQPGQPLHRERYERAMLLLSDLPGLRVQSAIEPGLEPGTTDLTVQVAPGDRVRASVELDNYGTREVGRERLGGTLRDRKSPRLNSSNQC